jgi:3-methylcrotonyl-CoA carboxylase alpha subunit
LAVYAVGESVAVFAPEGAALLREVDVLAHAGDAAAEGGRLTAPMPGKVVAFLAQPGEQVKRGQPLAVMEAMKMEHTLAAPSDGIVRALRFAAGEQVAEGEALLDFEAAA